jgi:hypothetical protein
MSTSPRNPAVSADLALRTMQDRREDAERRARVREIRAARREARQTGATPATTRPVPWWAFRFLHPAH